ncbi:(2Fe-2S)-binding protein, partial [Candidatus Bipolaricaulota bacterium]|nr:(2Fe-2S)-binding protein [Candidatus Bipolaricaulota bacterium]
MSNTLSIEINGEECAASPDKTILEACRDNDIFIPTLCEMEELDLPYGGCRTCLVEVETSDGKEITTSCDTCVEAGMKVNTETEEVFAERRAALELLLSEHTGDCVPPCTFECPASLDVQGYIAHIANGRPQAAVELIKEKTPLAVSLGRACFAPCENECRRELVEEPMAIRQLKEYA